MFSEDALRGLVKIAEEQQEALGKTLLGLQTQRGELNNSIAELKTVQTKVGADTRQGVKDGIRSIGVGLTTSSTAEVDKIKKTLSDMAEKLEKDCFWLKSRWILTFVLVGVVLGYFLCWVMWAKDAHGAAQRLDAIKVTLKQQTAAAAHATPQAHHRSSQSGN